MQYRLKMTGSVVFKMDGQPQPQLDLLSILV